MTERARLDTFIESRWCYLNKVAKDIAGRKSFADDLLSIAIEKVYNLTDEQLSKIVSLEGYCVSFMSNQSKWVNTAFHKEGATVGDDLSAVECVVADEIESDELVRHGMDFNRATQYRKLMKAVAQLDICESAVFDRYFVQGLDGVKIANITGEPLSQVYKLINVVKTKIGAPMGMGNHRTNQIMKTKS